MPLLWPYWGGRRPSPGGAPHPSPPIWPFWGGRRAVGASPPILVVPFKVALGAFLSSAPTLAGFGLTIEPFHPGETSAYPALTYRVPERAPGHHLGGSAGFADATVELEARSIDYGQTDAIIACLTNLFDGFQGDMAGVTVMSSLVDSDGDDYDEADDGSDAGTFEDTITIAIRYRLPSPSI